MLRVFQLALGWSRIAVRGQFFYLILQKNHNVKIIIAQPLFFAVIILSYLSFYLFIFYYIYLFLFWVKSFNKRCYYNIYYRLKI